MSGPYTCDSSDPNHLKKNSYSLQAYTSNSDIDLKIYVNFDKPKNTESMTIGKFETYYCKLLLIIFIT